LSTTVSPSAVPTGSLLGRIERTAWRVPLPTRRLFVVLAVVAAAAVLAGCLGAAWVASRNSATIADARDEGLGVAREATEFRSQLATADALAAQTLIAGGAEEPETRAAYVEALRAATDALVAASLVATPDDAPALEAMSDGLARYSGLVETGRANSRLGFPVGAAYLNQARALANDELAPTADQLRRVGEQRMARAANSVGGPIGVLAVAALLLGLVALLACAALVAGRTRRALHPALLAAALVMIGALVFVTGRINAQGRELREAATDDVGAYVSANEVANALSDLRVTEISAIAARGSGSQLYDAFQEDADALAAAIDERGEIAGNATLATEVSGYTAAVVDEGGVRDTDIEQGNNRDAAELAIGREGTSKLAFDEATVAAVRAVEAEDADLGARLGDASGADVNPLVPIVAGVVAALLAVVGTLDRGRRYR
jgi:hypothetical protein